jgi:hypothetical protein
MRQEGLVCVLEVPDRRLTPWFRGAPEWRVVFGVSRLTNEVDWVPFGRLRPVFGQSGGTEFWNALNREISETGKNLGRIVAP